MGSFDFCKFSQNAVLTWNPLHELILKGIRYCAESLLEVEWRAMIKEEAAVTFEQGANE